jgi:hypothetical protein
LTTHFNHEKFATCWPSRRRVEHDVEMCLNHLQRTV